MGVGGDGGRGEPHKDDLIFQSRRNSDKHKASGILIPRDTPLDPDAIGKENSKFKQKP